MYIIVMLAHVLKLTLHIVEHRHKLNIYNNATSSIHGPSVYNNSTLADWKKFKHCMIKDKNLRKGIICPWNNFSNGRLSNRLQLPHISTSHLKTVKIQYLIWKNLLLSYHLEYCFITVNNDIAFLKVASEKYYFHKRHSLQRSVFSRITPQK